MLSELNSKKKVNPNNTEPKFLGIREYGEISLRKPENKTNKISDNHILASLPYFEAARLLPHLEFVFLPVGEKIYSTDRSRDYIYFPETAVISDISNLEDGNTIETIMTGYEGASGLGLIIGELAPACHAEVSIGGSAWRIKTETLKQEFARGGKLQQLLLDALNRQTNQISQKLVCKAFHLIEKRFCLCLLMLRDRTQNNHLNLTQEIAALLLGANRPSVTIAAQTLRKNGLISYSRGGITILDEDGLIDFACECYSSLQLKH